MKTLSLLLALLFLLALPARAQVPQPEDLSAAAALLMDADTGQVLYSKNGDQLMAPASITKILTGLLAMEYLEEDQVLTASAQAADIPSWGTSIDLQAGEELTVRDAMYAMMLPSANDAANVIAEEIAGSLEAFAQLMNQRAAQLGAVHTHFTNANGLPDDDHLTTAYDMALITRQAIRIPGFLQYFGAESYSMPATNLSGERALSNTHRMLRSGYEEYDETVIGGKTGFTDQAGYTLVTVAQRAGRTLICVALHSEEFYDDTQLLLELGFEEFSPVLYRLEAQEGASVPLLDGDQQIGSAVLSLPGDPIVLLLHQDADLSMLSPSYTLPQSIDGEGSPEGVLQLEMEAQGANPSFVTLSIPLHVQSIQLTDPTPLETAPPQEPGEEEETSSLPLLSFLPPVLLLAVILLVLRARSRRNRRRRAYRTARAYSYSSRR